MMLHLLLAGAMAISAVDVQGETLSGKSFSGRLLELSSQSATIEVDGGETKTYPLRELLSLSRDGAEKVADEDVPIQVELVDGSSLNAVSLQVYGGEAAIGLVGGGQVSIDTRSITYAKLHLHRDLESQWREIVAKADEVTGDTIVIRKQKVDGGFALDTAEGIFYDITADKVQFEFDGEAIDVPRTRVEGVIYYHALRRESPKVVCRLVDAGGSEWNAQSISQQGDQLQFVAACGVEHAVPLARLVSLDFSGGKVVYLSDLKPDAATVQPHLDDRHTGDLLARWNRARFNESFDSSPLRLEEQSYSKGVALRSGTTLTYRLSDEFRRLTGAAAFHRTHAEQVPGSVELVVVGDGKEIQRLELSGQSKKSGEGKQPWPLDVNIEGVQRLKIYVDYGENGGIGDYLYLCNLRITK